MEAVTGTDSRTGELVCWNCGETLEDVPRRIPRFAQCSHCRAELHVCLMCRHYAPRYTSQCAHDRAERVLDKKRSNFCTFHRARPNAHLPPDTSVEDSSREELGALFGESAPETETKDELGALFGESTPESDSTQSEVETAKGELAGLFSLGEEESAPEEISDEEKTRQQLGALFADPEEDGD